MPTKTTRRALLIAAVAALFATPVLADDYVADISNKGGRGLANLSLGWLELFKNTYNEPVQNGPMYAPVGLAKGIYHTFGRTLAGVVETATFMIPTKPFVHPIYLWEEIDSETAYGDEYWKRRW